MRIRSLIYLTILFLLTLSVIEARKRLKIIGRRVSSNLLEPLKSFSFPI